MDPWRVALPVAFLLACIGCSGGGKPQAADGTPQPIQATRDEIVYERLRSSAFQLNAAADAVSAAYTMASDLRDRAPKNTDLSEALADLADYLDSAGAEVAEYTASPESIEVVKGNLTAFEKQLELAQKAAAMAKRDLEEALGIAESLLDQSDAGTHETFQTLYEHVKEAVDATADGLLALGVDPNAAEPE